MTRVELRRFIMTGLATSWLGQDGGLVGGVGAMRTEDWLDQEAGLAVWCALEFWVAKDSAARQSQRRKVRLSNPFFLGGGGVWAACKPHARKQSLG